MLRQYIVVLVLPLLISLAGCQKSPEDARRELAGLGISYSEEDFLKAVKNGDTLAVKLFLASGMDPNVRDSKSVAALVYAARGGHIDIVQMLLSHGAEVNLSASNVSYSETPLQAA